MQEISEIKEHRVTRTYSEGEKFKVVTTYVMLGSLIETARECDLSVDTIKSWKKQAWWPRMMSQVKGEENNKIAARYRNIILKTQEKLLERVEKGDIVLGKDGEQIAVPIKGRDLAVIAGIATQQVDRLDTEKQHEDSLSVAERLTKIAEELVKMNGKKRQSITIDVEEIHNGLQNEENETQNEEVNHAIQ